MAIFYIQNCLPWKEKKKISANLGGPSSVYQFLSNIFFLFLEEAFYLCIYDFELPQMQTIPFRIQLTERSFHNQFFILSLLLLPICNSNNQRLSSSFVSIQHPLPFLFLKHSELQRFDHQYSLLSLVYVHGWKTRIS